MPANLFQIFFHISEDNLITSRIHVTTVERQLFTQITISVDQASIDVDECVTVLFCQVFDFGVCRFK
jgi:hypothetical protein